MRDIKHPNLCLFIGACIDTEHVAILNEVCGKGSLKDILSNDDIDLGWDFKYSMMKVLIVCLSVRLFCVFNALINLHWFVNAYLFPKILKHLYPVKKCVYNIDNIYGPRFSSAILSFFCFRIKRSVHRKNNNILIAMQYFLDSRQDIARGMMYLQNTDIRSHGRLKSSNCLVDNRWTVKISGTRLLRNFYFIYSRKLNFFSA